MAKIETLPLDLDGDDEVIIVAHGEQGGEKNNSALQALTERLSRALPNSKVSCGVLFGEPALKTTLQQSRAKRLFVYPLFLSDGYLVRVVLPKLLREHVEQGNDGVTPHGCRFSMLTPMGLSPQLPELLNAEAEDSIAPAELKTSNLLVVAHGSPTSARPKQCTEEIVGALADIHRFKSLDCLYLSETPHLDEAGKQIPENTVILPLFAGKGRHAVQDIEVLMKNAPTSCCKTTTAGAISGVDQLVLKALKEALSDPEDPNFLHLAPPALKPVHEDLMQA